MQGIDANAVTKQNLRSNIRPIDSSVSSSKQKVHQKRNSYLVDRVQKQSFVPASNKVNTARGGERQTTGLGSGQETGADYGANQGRQSDDQFELPNQEVTGSFKSQVQVDQSQSREGGPRIYNEATQQEAAQKVAGSSLNRTIM